MNKEITPRRFRARTDKLLAHSPAVREEFDPKQIATFQSEDSLRAESQHADESSFIYGEAYDNVEFQMMENRRLNNRVIPWIWG